MPKFIKYFNEFILENIKMKIDLPQDILDIADAYFKAGKELFVVGGFIRDFVKYGHINNAHDIDLVTNALPDESKEILKDFNVSSEHGSSFAILRIFTPNFKEGIEIASFRKDIVKNGRDTKGTEQKVETGKHITIEDDVKRRDLKSNGLFYNIKTNEIIDLVGGIDSIKNNIFGAIGCASDRFDEDQLRKIRLIRFTSRSYGKIDKETSDALKQNNSLKTVSKERIYEEFVNKMLDYAQKHNDLKMMQTYLDLIDEYNMWEEMFPKMKITPIHNLKTLNAAIIFAMLFETNENMSKYLILDLKFPERMTNQICFLINFKNKINDIDKTAFKLLIEKERYHISNDLIEEYADVLHLNKHNVDKFIKYSNVGITTSGDDLLSQGFKGKEIGEEKERRELEIFKNLK